MQYEWYADIFWITCFLTDLTAFLTASFTAGNRIKIGRCAGAAALSAVAETVLFVVMNSYTLYRMVILWGVNPLLVIIFMSPRNLKDFLKGYITVFGVILVTGGVQNFFLEAVSGPKHQELWLIILAFGSGGILCLMKIRKSYQRSLCEAELVYGEKHVVLKAFYDTGNMLRDPFTGRPVSIAGEQVFAGQTEDGAGVRYIPYRTLGNEHGLLKVLTIDKMYIYLPGKKLEVIKPVIGLSQTSLLEEKNVGLILNGALLTENA